MKRNDISDAIFEKTGVNKSDIVKVLDALPEVVSDGLLDDGKVLIRGLMNIEIYERQGRNGYNPITKEKTIIEPHKAIRCKLSRQILGILDCK